MMLIEAAEAVLAEPDDLLLAADAAMVVAVAARALADRELVLHDPGEVAGRDPEGPLAAQARRHQQVDLRRTSATMLPAGTERQATRRATVAVPS